MKPRNCASSAKLHRVLFRNSLPPRQTQLLNILSLQKMHCETQSLFCQKKDSVPKTHHDSSLFPAMCPSAQSPAPTQTAFRKNSRLLRYIKSGTRPKASSKKQGSHTFEVQIWILHTLLRKTNTLSFFLLYFLSCSSRTALSHYSHCFQLYFFIPVHPTALMRTPLCSSARQSQPAAPRNVSSLSRSFFSTTAPIHLSAPDFLAQSTTPSLFHEKLFCNQTFTGPSFYCPGKTVELQHFPSHLPPSQSRPAYETARVIQLYGFFPLRLWLTPGAQAHTSETKLRHICFTLH